MFPFKLCKVLLLLLLLRIVVIFAVAVVVVVVDFVHDVTAAATAVAVAESHKPVAVNCGFFLFVSFFNVLVLIWGGGGSIARASASRSH